MPTDKHADLPDSLARVARHPLPAKRTAAATMLLRLLVIHAVLVAGGCGSGRDKVTKPTNPAPPPGIDAFDDGSGAKPRR